MAPNGNRPQQSVAVPRRVMKTYLVGISRTGGKPLEFTVIDGPLSQYHPTAVGNPVQKHILTAPAPTPSPWCPPSASGSSNNYVCGWLTPPNGEADIAIYCANCTSNDGTLTGSLTFDSSYPEQGNFVTQTLGCQNPTGGSSPTCTQPSVCAVGSTCQAQTCWQPYPYCYVETQYLANEGTPPSNVVTHTQFTNANGSVVPPNDDAYITVTPDVEDLDINATDQVVSYPHPTPSSLMVGQEVQLRASPAASLSSETWTFDSPAPSSVIGSYALVGPTPMAPNGPTYVAAPSPVPSSGNPIVFYWVDKVNAQPRHLYLNATAPGVQGPLIVDVYYPVFNTGGSLADGTSNVAVGSDAISSDGCKTVTTITALFLGMQCKIKPNAKPTPGVNLTWSAGESAATGYTAAVQLRYLSYSGPGRQFADSRLSE